MKNIYWIIALLLVSFSSCVTESKVNRWLDDHKEKAAGYCADNFPPDTISKTVTENIDSAGYYDAYMNMAYLADSLFYKLDSLMNAATPDKPYKPNLDSIRKVVDKEIKKRLKPCIDTVKVVTNTVIDRAREALLKILVDKKDFVIAEMQVKADERENKIRGQRKWFFLFWGLVVAAGLYTFLKMRYKLKI
jgi:hypothetical protein